MYQRFLKRWMDIVLSGCALIALSPVLCITALMVRVKLGAPVVFTQERPGKDERIFKMYKFRSMTSETDAQGNLLPDELRLKKFGKLLRSTSLDELPELWNIFKGDMSIIGPRPLLVRYLPRYNQRQRQRHAVRPGLSGLAQISGRNAITWEEKFELDVQYVENITFLGDVTIICKTILKAVAREGISSQVSVTMEEFKGSQEKLEV